MIRAKREPTAWMRWLLNLAVLTGLVALALMVWSVYGTTPLLLIVFMTVGQALSGLSFLAFVAVIVVDLVRSRVIGPNAQAADLRGSEGDGGDGAAR
jgi:polyferredoxin